MGYGTRRGCSIRRVRQDPAQEKHPPSPFFFLHFIVFYLAFLLGQPRMRLCPGGLFSFCNHGRLVFVYRGYELKQTNGVLFSLDAWVFTLGQ